MTGRRQIEQFIEAHRDPASLPSGRFETDGDRKVRCVLCGRAGYGPIVYNETAVYVQRERGHRKLLTFIGDDLVQVDGPDTAPPPPRPKPWWSQFSPWQIGCMVDHNWPCTCGLRFPCYANLWRHIGANRPAGWGRQGVHEFALDCEVAT